MNIKGYISILALCLTILSCKKEPEVGVAEKIPIEFNPSILTKAYIQDATNVEFQKGFGVFAKKTERTDPSKKQYIMENTKVYHDGTGWTYRIPNDAIEFDPIYWGLNCDHDFFAIFPFSADKTAQNYNYTFTPEQNSCIIKNGINTIDESGNNIGRDIMYARHSQYYDLGMKIAPIGLKMNHALSAISVVMTNHSDQIVTKAENIKLYGLYTNATEINIPIEIKTQDDVVSISPDTGSRSDYPSNGQTASKFYSFPNKENMNLSQGTNSDGTREQAILVDPCIVIPQDFAHYDTVLEFKIYQKKNKTVTSRIITIPLSDYPVDNEDLQHQFEYVSGKHYKYTLKITTQGISAEVKIVPWKHEVIDLL